MSGMSDKSDLKEMLSRLATALPREASAAAEQRVMTAFRSQRRYSASAWAFWGTAAACLAIGLIGFWARTPQAFLTAGVTNDSFHRATAGFVALPYAESGVPLEQAVIVRVSLQPSELGALGLSLAPTNASRRVSADLLIGQDGVTRAVRLLE